MERLSRSFSKAWPCIASGLLILLAFPPLNLWPILFVALVPWLNSVRTLKTKSAWKSGYLFGFIYGMGQLFWLAQFVGKWVGSMGIAMVPFLVACSLYASYFGWLGIIAQRTWSRKLSWWLFPLAWAGVEVVRSYVPVFAFPWGLLASPMSTVPDLIQFARFGTIYGMSALVVAVNVGIVLGLDKANRGVPLRVLGGVALIVVASYFLVPSAPGTSKRFVIVQPGVDMAFGNNETRKNELNRHLGALLEEAAQSRPTLALLPEGMARIEGSGPSVPFPSPNGLPIIFGGQRRIPGGKVFQSAFGHYGPEWQYGDKTRLVIFGEFVPGRDTFPFLAESFKLPSGDLVPGENGVRPIEINEMVTGPLLCFEGLFPDLAYRQARNGARILTIMSIDDWFMGTNAPDQLRDASVWRAVETGLPVLRSASLGYSIAVDARGHIVAQTPLGQPRAIPVELNVPDRPPTYWWLPAFPLLGLLAALVATIFKAPSDPDLA